MKQLQRWDEAFSTGETNEILLSISRLFAKEVSDGSLREFVTSLIDSNDILGLCSLEIDYTSISVIDAIHVRQISALFSKREDLDLGIDKERVALDAFLAAEQLCRETNNIFRLRIARGFNFPRGVEPVLHLAQRKISEILGSLPSIEQLRLRFGPGATTSVKKKNACPRIKLGSPFACSEGLLPHIDSVLSQMPGWLEHLQSNDGESFWTDARVEIHTGKVGFVPKSWKTYRSISTEPVLNSMLQLGIGDYIADRLRAFGQDIKDQQRNRASARVGSLDGSLSTLDLSSASDTIASGLVADLLPLDWYLSLDAARTEAVTMPDGSLVRLQKFATMGNGFTFPLETLIFYAITYGAVSHLGGDVRAIQVYGDDIICPTDCVSLVVTCLTACGFKINSGKSYTNGPFRESCGADYLRGIDIRPCYMKTALTGESLFVLHNSFRRRLFDEQADVLLQYLDESLLLWGPDGYGDGHLLPAFGKDVTAYLHSHRREDGYGGFTFETFTNTHRALKKRRMPGDFVFPLYSIYISEGKEDQQCPDGQRLHVVMTSGKRIEPLEPSIQLATYDKNQRLTTPLPGVKGYKRIKIYTFSLG